MMGASHSAIRNPITTEGTEAMISTTGLIVCRRPGRGEVTDVSRPEQAERHGKQHGVEGALERAEHQRHEAELRLEIFPARRLPYVVRRVIAFVKNLAEERLEADFRASAVDSPHVERAGSVQSPAGHRRAAPRPRGTTVRPARRRCESRLRSLVT